MRWRWDRERPDRRPHRTRRRAQHLDRDVIELGLERFTLRHVRDVMRDDLDSA